ncbi:MAG: 2,3-bisphosphoglycerate-independent phosphoglycerate mutase [candidate division WOR-3 bacterium]
MFDYRLVPIEPNDKKIVLVILDGLGGLPLKDKTELETAWVPNLDQLAVKSALGKMVPIARGVTPGSGAAHLAIFGYDPVQYPVGRGVLEALGCGLNPGAEDLCARANFATVDENGVITDRRAKENGERMRDQECAELCELLQEEIAEIDGVKVTIVPGKGHRFVVMFSGPGLADGLSDSDPGKEGKAPLPVQALKPEAARSAQVANRFIELAAGVLKGRKRANYVLLRGLALPPRLPNFQERYQLRAAAIAAYPMYRGLARLVGMRVLPCGETWESEIETLEKNYAHYDFFYIHFKEFDQAGEDGDFERKVELLEQFDERIVPRLVKLNPDVLCITGDHSTPAVLKGHSWHTVPLLIHSPWVRVHSYAEEFGERACIRGSIGLIFGVEIMPLLMANAQRFGKFGA